MRLGRWLSLPVLVALAAGSSATGAAPLLQQLSRAHFDFTLGLYSALVDGGGGDEPADLLVSPYSVFSLLSMLFLGTGAESPAAAQLRTVLRLKNISYAGVQRAFKQAILVMQQPYYKHMFSAKMGLFLSREVKLSALYERALTEFYQNRVNSVDFGSDQAQEELSVWLRSTPEVDGGRTQVMARVPEKPVLLLMSKTHFHGQWMHPFDASMTFDKGLFFHKPSQRMEVPMMKGRLRLPLGYSYDLEARVLELPLRERRVSLFLLLPDALEQGLQRLEANLTTDNLRALLSTLKEETVNVKLPRFRLWRSGNLKSSLMEQGLLNVFNSSAAEMTGIAEDGRVHLSDLLYSASLVVDETGPVGADADLPPSPPPLSSRRRLLKDKYFEVDHPFVFLVWDYHSAMVLLMGRVVRPEPVYI